jgi:hypothetical protein
LCPNNFSSAKLLFVAREFIMARRWNNAQDDQLEARMKQGKQ